MFKFRYYFPPFFILFFVLAQKAVAEKSVGDTITVDFSKVTGKIIDPKTFGLNGYGASKATIARMDNLRSNLAFMNPGLIRYHNWGMIDQSENSWVDINYRWDREKIKRVLQEPLHNLPVRLINIPWAADPAWLFPKPEGKVFSDARLRPEHYADFAKWCADLVRIVNIDLKCHIVYWEITNERDVIYNKDCDELGRIYNLCRDAMKAVDPLIICGGPAFTGTSPEKLKAFFSITKDKLDFVSYHSYETGDQNMSNQQVYDRAANRNNTSEILSAWKAQSDRKIGFYHDEYNINWFYKSPSDPKMKNDVSMIYDAIMMLNFAATDGLTASCAWNDADNVYGKLDGVFNKRPSAYLFKVFNDQLRNLKIVSAAVNEKKDAVGLAGLDDSAFKIAVVNRKEADINVVFRLSGMPASFSENTKVKAITCLKEGGIATKKYTMGELRKGVVLKSQTVTVFTVNGKG